VSDQIRIIGPADRRLKILCAFGEHNYGDAARGEGPEHAAFLPALRNLGHEVRLLETWNRSAYSDLAALNTALLNAVEAFRPDLLLTVQMNYEIWLETLELIRARGDVITLSWATDDSWKYREVSRFIAGSYDAMATTYEHVVRQYHADGYDHVFVTQWAAVSDLLQEPLNAERCRYPVSFVGTAHGQRAQWVEFLRAHGIDVVCFGYGWPNGPVAAQDIRRIIRESQISLNFANSRGENQIKSRMFEVPGAGGFLLTESARSLERFYRPGHEIAVYDGLEDLMAKINHYLANPHERDRLAKAGFKRTREEHTYEQRFMALLNFALSTSQIAPHPIPTSSFEEAVADYRLTPFLRILRDALKQIGVLAHGKERGPRAARRLVYELSWRLAGRQTFTAKGWPGRMFPHD
jgi:spore maturation protein CgeB